MSIASSLIFPGVITTSFIPFSMQKLSCCNIVFLNEGIDLGLMIPVVPMIEMPPMIPSLGLQVKAATSSPLGTDILTSTPREDSSLMEEQVIFLGTG